MRSIHVFCRVFCSFPQISLFVRGKEWSIRGKNDAREERGNIFCGQVYKNKKLEKETLIIIKLDCKSTLYILILEDKEEQKESQSSMDCQKKIQGILLEKMTLKNNKYSIS